MGRGGRGEGEGFHWLGSKEVVVGVFSFSFLVDMSFCFSCTFWGVGYHFLGSWLVGGVWGPGGEGRSSFISVVLILSRFRV